MRYNPFNRFLFQEVTEHGSGSAAAPAAAITTPAASAPPEAAPAAPAPAAAAPPAAAPAAAAPAATAPPRDPTRLEMVTAAIRDKAVIIAENTQLKTTVAAHLGSIAERDTTIATLNARVTTLEGENKLLQADLATIDDALKATKAQVASVDASAARQIAGMGFDPAALPAAEKEGDSLDAMEARLGKETDPEKIVTLARQIDALKAKPKA